MLNAANIPYVTAYDQTARERSAVERPHAWPSRIGAMLYALLAYAIGLGALSWLMLAALGFAPFGLIGPLAQNAFMAIIINCLLVMLFAIQHSVMARHSFKRWLCRYLPEHLERASFVLCAGLVTAAMLYCWQPMPGIAWQIELPIGRHLLLIVGIVGAVYLVTSSFVTGHFELFGLRQAYLHLIGRDYQPLPFQRRWMYSYSRHPMMLGLLMLFWGTPDMSVTRLLLALLLTLYMIPGIRLEERSLTAEHGDDYRRYQRQIGRFYTLDR